MINLVGQSYQKFCQKRGSKQKHPRGDCEPSKGLFTHGIVEIDTWDMFKHIEYPSKLTQDTGAMKRQTSLPKLER